MNKAIIIHITEDQEKQWKSTIVNALVEQVFMDIPETVYANIDITDCTYHLEQIINDHVNNFLSDWVNKIIAKSTEDFKSIIINNLVDNINHENDEFFRGILKDATNHVRKMQHN